jgi:two-component system, LytTR family, response regulator
MKPEITAIIVEDIKDYHVVIETFIQEVAPNVRIVGNATTLEEAEKLILQRSPALLFLDIQFEAEGKTAFDLLKKFSKLNGYYFQVIITTAHNEAKYYEEAFNFGALHFLTKPIDKFKLQEAIDRVQNNLPGIQINHWLNHVQKTYDQLNSNKVPEKMVIDGMNYTEVVQIKDIVYMEASGRYTYIYVAPAGNQPICSTSNLGEYEKQLNGHPDFFRIHRTTILNINYVLRFSKKDHSIILPPPYAKLFASKEKFKEFLKHIDSHHS